MTAQDVLDGHWIDDEAEFQQFTVNLIVPHPWVLTGDAENQRLNVGFQPWSPSAIQLSECPLAPDEFSMPFQHRFGLGQQNGFVQTLLPVLRL